MRVLHVVGALPNSGSSWLQPFVAAQIESLRRIGLRIDVLDLSAGGSGLEKYILGIAELQRRTTTNRYDLIHAHYSYCGWVARFQKSIPLIVSLMGSDLLGTPDTHGRQTLRGHFDIALTRVLASNADHIIVKSNAMAKLLPGRDNISVIPNGVDFGVFKPLDRSGARGQLGIDLRAKVILFAANPDEPRKNYRLAEEAVALLQSQSKSPCTLLAFYGRSHMEMPVAMNAADVLLVTSFWEGSPNTVKEALACNLPVVSVRVGDVPEVTAGVKNCYLVDYDPADVAAKIDCAVQSGKRSNGRQHVDHLRLEIVAVKLLETYQHVLS